KDDHFTLTFKNPPAGATALRLEALTDKRLPGFGPGKVYYEGTPGDFFLYTLTAKADGREIRLADASSTVGDAKLAVDGKDLTGWTIKERVGQNQAAVFHLAEPLPPTGALVIELRMGRYNASTLGNFRFSVTTSAGKTTSRALPKELEDLRA